MDTSISASADECEADRSTCASPRPDSHPAMSREEQDADEAPADAEPDEPEPSRAGVALDLAALDSVHAELDADWLASRTHAALGLLGCERGELSVVIVDDETMRAAHQEHLGIDTTTDVLTFNLADAALPANAIDAEIYICADEAARQARERRHSLERELLLYIIHGVLHCLGYDDLEESQYERMHRREDEILRLLGVGATFDPDAQAHLGRAAHPRRARTDQAEDSTT